MPFTNVFDSSLIDYSNDFNNQDINYIKTKLKEQYLDFVISFLKRGPYDDIEEFKQNISNNINWDYILNKHNYALPKKCICYFSVNELIDNWGGSEYKEFRDFLRTKNIYCRDIDSYKYVEPSIHTIEFKPINKQYDNTNNLFDDSDDTLIESFEYDYDNDQFSGFMGYNVYLGDNIVIKIIW